MTSHPLLRAAGKILLAQAPAILLLSLGYSDPRRVSYLAGHAPAASVLPREVQETGLHIYGWEYKNYAILNSFPSHPDLDTDLAVTMFTGSLSDYLEHLASDPNPPLFILDQVSTGEGGWLRGVPPIKKLRLGEGRAALQPYQRVERTRFGVLYRRDRQ